MSASTPKDATQRAFEAFARELSRLTREVNRQRKLVQQQIVPPHELPDGQVPVAYEQALAALTSYVASISDPNGPGFVHRNQRYLIRGVEVELVRPHKALGNDQPITAVIVRGFIKPPDGGHSGNYSSQSSSSRGG